MSNYEVAVNDYISNKILDSKDGTILFGIACLTYIACKAIDNGYNCDFSSPLFNFKLFPGGV